MIASEKVIVNKNEIGKNIKKYRTEANLSQSAFAAKVYTTKSTISKWESGDIVPSIDMAKIIAKALNISLYEILGEKQPLSSKIVNWVAKALLWLFAWVHIDITFIGSVGVTAVALVLVAVLGGVGGFIASLISMILRNDFNSMRVAILIGYLIWAPLFFAVFGTIALGLYIVARQTFVFSQKYFWKNRHVRWEASELKVLGKLLKNKKLTTVLGIVLARSAIYFIIVVTIEGTSALHWSNFSFNF